MMSSSESTFLDLDSLNYRAVVITVTISGMRWAHGAAFTSVIIFSRISLPLPPPFRSRRLPTRRANYSRPFGEMRTYFVFFRDRERSMALAVTAAGARSPVHAKIVRPLLIANGCRSRLDHYTEIYDSSNYARASCNQRSR